MTAGIPSASLALWESNLEIVSETSDEVMCISLSRVSVIREKLGVSTPHGPSVKVEENFLAKNSTLLNVDVRTSK